MANLSMKTGPKGLALIKEFEGLRTKAYLDTGGVLTIGYGHTTAAGAPTVRTGMQITKEEAEAILKRDLAQAERDVCALVKVPLTQGQFDALVSFAFNCGSDIDADTKAEGLGDSTLLKKLNAGQYEAVPNELRKWVNDNGRKINGLVRRREAEAALWSEASAQPPPPDIEPIEAPKANWLASLLLAFAALFKRKAA